MEKKDKFDISLRSDEIQDLMQRKPTWMIRYGTTFLFLLILLGLFFTWVVKYPDIILVPLLAFDERLYRLGYGGGYYDRYIEKAYKKKPFIKVGLALSVQKIDNVPTTKYDKKLDYIVTEKYIL